MAGAMSQVLRDVFVLEPMEAVAADALGIEALWDAIMVGDAAVTAMEGGIEAGDLGKIGKALEQRADWGEIVGLMQRRQRNCVARSQSPAAWRAAATSDTCVGA
jgi:hypothetical protein